MSATVGNPRPSKGPALACREKTHLVRLQNGAGQTSRYVRTGVDIDPVGMNFWRLDRCMSVHHDFAPIRLAQQEFASDPQQVVVALLGKRYPRTDTGMAQEIRASCERNRERGEKRKMRLRKTGTQLNCRPVKILASYQPSDIDAVGMQCFEATVVSPLLEQRGLDKKPLEDSFVIALQRHKIGAKRIARQKLDDLAQSPDRDQCSRRV